METLFTTLVPNIPTTAIPIVFVVIACYYIYKRIGSEREDTKKERDADSISIHDKLLKHDFEIANLKGQSVHHEDVLDDLRKQITALNESIIRLTVTIEKWDKNK